MVLEDDSIRILVVHGADVVDAVDIAVLASMIIVFVVAILHIMIAVTFIIVIIAWLVPLLLVLLFTRLLAFFLILLRVLRHLLALDMEAARGMASLRFRSAPTAEDGGQVQR